MNPTQPDPTPEVNGAQPGQGEKKDKDKASHLHERPGLNLVHKVLGITASILAVATFIVLIYTKFLSDDSASGATDPTSPPQATSSAQNIAPSQPTDSADPADPADPIDPAASSTEQPAVVGSCLDAVRSDVPCNSPHAFEVVAATDADCARAAIQYAAGDPDLDVTTLSSAVEPVGGSPGACLLTSSVGQTFPFAMKEILATRTENVSFRM